MAQTWRLGIFRNDEGALVTVYTNAAGEPVPYEQKRVGNRPLLMTAVFQDMKYSEARALLLKAAEEGGITGTVRVKGAGLAKARAARAAAVEAGEPLVNDAGVPTIDSALVSAGWKSRIFYIDHLHKDGALSTSIFTSPQGVEYVHARPNEKADLIFKARRGMPAVRLREYSTSGTAKRAEKSKEKAAEAVGSVGMKSRARKRA